MKTEAVTRSHSLFLLNVKKTELLDHSSLKPFIYKDSKILILGSFPSVKSREYNFYYSNKNNRFFKILYALFDEEYSTDISDRKEFLRRHKIALYDVVESCEIRGSDDSSIKVSKIADIASLLKTADISMIFITGKKALGLFEENFDYPHIYLPSPSSANASFTLDKLIDEYRVIKDYL